MTTPAPPTQGLTLAVTLFACPPLRARLTVQGCAANRRRADLRDVCQGCPGVLALARSSGGRTEHVEARSARRPKRERRRYHVPEAPPAPAPPPSLGRSDSVVKRWPKRGARVPSLRASSEVCPDGWISTEDAAERARCPKNVAWQLLYGRGVRRWVQRSRPMGTWWDPEGVAAWLAVYRSKPELLTPARYSGWLRSAEIAAKAGRSERAVRLALQGRGARAVLIEAGRYAKLYHPADVDAYLAAPDLRKLSRNENPKGDHGNA